jgi:hypothetical protein
VTCIAGVVDGNRVVMGADSAGVGGWNLSLRADEKVFVKDKVIVGFTSSFRMGQLLRYTFQVPSHIENMDPFEYMVTSFVEGLRTCLRNGGFAQKANERETGGTFLVGYRGRLFSIQDDYQVEETICGYNACGSGEQIAVGSLFSSIGKMGEDRIRLSLQAAEAHSATVRAPFVIRSIGDAVPLNEKPTSRVANPPMPPKNVKVKKGFG